MTRSIEGPSSQRYMLPTELKSRVLKLYEQVKVAADSSFQEDALLNYLDARTDVSLPEAAEAACAVGQIRGIALAACSSVRELLGWARSPDVAKATIDWAVSWGRRIANLDAPFAREHYERVIARQLSRESELGACNPECEVLCEGCLNQTISLQRDGTLYDLAVGVICLFEYLPVTEESRRLLLCFDCAAEAYAIRSAGFAPLYLDEFQEALAEVKDARESDPDNDQLYEDGASVSHYEAAMRQRLDRIRGSELGRSRGGAFR